ncbi:MAG: site-specific integrase [Planctomycetes bacterium]|nr:site-specific integrase [Planctomycetota bacterium]
MSARKVPALRHHKARGLAVVTLGGKDFYCGKFGSPESRREYDRVVGEWLAAGRPEVVGAPHRLTVAELLVRYMRFAAGYYLPPSREIEGITLALRPLKEKYGHTLAADFGPLALRAVRDGWVRAGLARKHINARVGKIRRLFKFAVAHELVPPGVLDGLRAVEPLTFGHTTAVESAPRDAVPERVFTATLSHVSPTVRAMLELLWWTGARPNEICSMRTADVDRTGETWVYRPRSHKNVHRGHERRIFLGPQAQRVLAVWLRDDGEEFIFQPREAVKAQRAGWRKAHRTDATRARAAANKRRAAADARRAQTGSGRPASRRAAGDRYTPQRLANVVRRVCIKHKLPRWTPYMIRHATATRIERTIDFDTARKVLGQRSAAVTQRYVHADGQAAAAAMAKFG